MSVLLMLGVYGLGAFLIAYPVAAAIGTLLGTYGPLAWHPVDEVIDPAGGWGYEKPVADWRYLRRWSE